ncbi:MAG: DUF1294 domain-containing protein [Phycisphaerales bacterium]|nr:MAG: DUF1294 domain-containing protein [Phycisphaerales bacterium]
MQWIVLGVIGVWYGVASLVTIALYAHDKRSARKGRWRVSERTLHRWELLGGWPGALVGQRLFKHKRRKQSYRRVFWMIVFLHVAGLALLLRLMR